MTSRQRAFVQLGSSLSGVAATVVLLRWLAITNATIVALSLLIVVLGTATLSRLWVAAACSLLAALALNFFFMPPLGTLTIVDPQNWVALTVFLVVAVVASHLSASAQARAQEAITRRQEQAQLFDLSQDVLLATEQPEPLHVLATQIVRRFNLAGAALCLPAADGTWTVWQGGSDSIAVSDSVLSGAMASAQPAPNANMARTGRAQPGHSTAEDASSGGILMVPLRLGVRVIGLLAARDGALEANALDAIAGLAALAVERTQLLAERKQAELVRERVELASTLLASLSHDLRTPLTAIGIALDNLQAKHLRPDEREEQGRLARFELHRLERLFRDILDMARIDAAALTVAPEWVTAADVIDAALSGLRPALDQRTVNIDADASTAVFVDPRLTSRALAHLLENAGQYSPADRPIDVRGWVDADGLQLVVRDHGDGLDAEDIDRLFERFFRGRRARERYTLGTGMGLAITRGLLTAEGGSVSGATASGRGSQFTIRIPSAGHPVLKDEEE